MTAGVTALRADRVRHCLTEPARARSCSATAIRQRLTMYWRCAGLTALLAGSAFAAVHSLLARRHRKRLQAAGPTVRSGLQVRESQPTAVRRQPVCVAAARARRVVHEADTAMRMQVVAAWQPQTVPQQLALVEVLPSPRQAIDTLSDWSAVAGDVLTALMAIAMTAARGSRATVDLVKANCIEALSERLRMSAADRAEPKDERRCSPRLRGCCATEHRTLAWPPSTLRHALLTERHMTVMVCCTACKYSTA